MKFVGLDGLKHFWSKAKIWIVDRITYEVTAKIAEIVANAPEDLDTLKEVSDWIKNHANDASAMNSAILANTEAISGKADKSHTHTKSDITDFAHTHDDRYYTESEVDTKLSGKSDTGHTHDYWPRSTQTLNLSSLDESLYYPCTAGFNTTGLARLQVDVHLDSGTKPNWSTHINGFSCHFDILTNPSNWGSSEVTRIILKDDFTWANLNPVGWSQMTHSSIAVLWLRGGGRYHIAKDYFGDFSIQTSTYTVKDQSVAPRSDRVLEGNTLVADRA